MRWAASGPVTQRRRTVFSLLPQRPVIGSTTSPKSRVRSRRTPLSRTSTGSSSRGSSYGGGSNSDNCGPSRRLLAHQVPAQLRPAAALARLQFAQIGHHPLPRSPRRAVRFAHRPRRVRLAVLVPLVASEKHERSFTPDASRVARNSTNSRVQVFTTSHLAAAIAIGHAPDSSAKKVENDVQPFNLDKGITMPYRASTGWRCAQRSAGTGPAADGRPDKGNGSAAALRMLPTTRPLQWGAISRNK